MSIQRFVGIDVSKAELAMHVLPDGLAWTQANTPEGHACLVQCLAQMGCERIVLEASGGYEQAVLQALSQAGLPVVRLPAHRPRALAQALGLKAKTDALDARLLAMAAQCIHAQPTAVLPAPLQALRELLHLRSTLVAQRDAQRRCLEHVTCEAVRDQWREVIALLQQRIRELSRQIARAAAACSSLPKVPGLGPILRATLAARLPELGTVPARKIAALVGLLQKSRPHRTSIPLNPARARCPPPALQACRSAHSAPAPGRRGRPGTC